MTVLGNTEDKPKMLKSSYSNLEIPPYPSQQLLSLLIHPSVTQSILPAFQEISRSYRELHAIARELLLELDDACRDRNQFQQDCTKLKNLINQMHEEDATEQKRMQGHDDCEIND